ncbi:nectin-4-like [Arapaima gigas]
MLVLHLNQNLVALLCLLWCRASLAVRVITSGNLSVPVGEPATFRCELDGNGSISQVEWVRCEGHKVMVFHVTSGNTVSENYKERISEVTEHGFKLKTLSNDSGNYCCTLSTFPYGNLKGQVYLQLTAPGGSASSSPTMTIFIIIGVFVALLLVTVGVVLLRKRQQTSIRQPVHVVIHARGFPLAQSFLKGTPSNFVPKADSNQAGHTSEHTEEDREDRADYFNVLS